MRIGVGFMILPAWAVPAETRPDQWRIENISMSSFIGHSLAALAIYEGSRCVPWPNTNWRQVAALIILSSSPDIDYLLPILRPVAPAAPPDQLSWWICSWMGCAAAMAPHTIRVTHSVVGVLVLAGLGIMPFLLADGPKFLWPRFTAQAIAVGFSHLLLDFLVSATPTAFFWPVSNTAIILPVSILPRLGEISVTNPGLYFAILVEIFVFAPLWATVHWLKRQRHV